MGDAGLQTDVTCGWVVVGANGGLGIVEGEIGVDGVGKRCWDVLVNAGCYDVLVFGVIKVESRIDECI